MAPLSSNGKGDVWFKVFEDGYDAGSKKWCVDKIRANGGKLNIKLPADIKAGNYLLRTEIIALHESDTDYAVNPARGSQYYPNCAQVSVTGGGSAVPKGYAIPGIYKTNSPGILFNLYSSYSSYPIPGPPLYTGGAGSSPSSTPSVAAPTASAVQTSGRPKPTVTSSAPSVPKPTQPSSDKYITITKTKTKTKTKTNTKAIYATKTVHNCNA
ncbi:hypothetical protein EC988_009272 [Linderina pennispora]|nr:hypothetical protein EC988_009272 [Linderina pennispora]